ncbi:uncharacterized protein DUF202 [Arthrobacter sp. SLBN-112]|jgi:uncharacterized membrane protein YidH (DUF202 family)|uniref:DUF202 domain-containing protein n=1 Tax=Arthrobacter sp. SLBN-112 TaxID=2768452 RepID=UPI001154EF56|nr:DUF202 domain-containing protein [Arthrobacter sp. SLBN-112]TQJ39118.1 uncharacterized protein DUF202 [Arthrobacter sp. SLBN-112]
MPAPRNTLTHGDAGLQPERTDLAWGRTTLSLVVAAALFLRWLPHHGWFIGTLVTAATLTAIAISLTRRRRFHRAIYGIKHERMVPDTASAAALAASVVILSLLGIYAVLFLPLE